MNNQTTYYPALTSETILNNFQEKNVTRANHSFFGKEMDNSDKGPKQSTSPAKIMLRVFSSANLMLPEPSLFGIPFSEFGLYEPRNEPVSPKMRKFVLPKGQRQNYLPAAA